MNEEQLQAKCTQWFWNNYPAQRRMLFHVQNNANSAVQGSRYKAIGVVSGVSDLVWVIYNKVIFIELKININKQTGNQIEFETKVTQRGHEYVLINSFEDFKSFIKSNILILQNKF